MASRPFPRASPYHQSIEICSPSTLCLGLECYKHSPPVHLTDRHPVPSWALRLVGWGNLEHKAGGWPTETTTSLLCYNEFAFCLISDDLYHTSLARPLPLAPDSLTLARLPGLGACRTLPRRTVPGTKWDVVVDAKYLWNPWNETTQGSSDPLPTELLVPNRGWWVLDTNHRFEEMKMIIFVRSTHDWQLVALKPTIADVESVIQHL